MIELFENREAASLAAADALERALLRRLAASDSATLVVSGGTTPIATLEALSARDVPWSRVHVVPSDERCVPPNHADSNERMLTASLLKGPAASAQFLSLAGASSGGDTEARALDEAVRGLPIPFACSLLGMGEDGHFASLFPDFDALDDALGVDADRFVMPVLTTASPHPRVTLTVSALSRSDGIILLLFGDAKRAVIEQAMEEGAGLPVSSLLRQKRAPVRVIWAP